MNGGGLGTRASIIQIEFRNSVIHLANALQATTPSQPIIIHTMTTNRISYVYDDQRVLGVQNKSL
jgi:hypothetical protein